jgi:hypothetical protein
MSATGFSAELVPLARSLSGTSKKRSEINGMVWFWNGLSRLSAWDKGQSAEKLNEINDCPLSALVPPTGECSGRTSPDTHLGRKGRNSAGHQIGKRKPSKFRASIDHRPVIAEVRR